MCWLEAWSEKGREARGWAERGRQPHYRRSRASSSAPRCAAPHSPGRSWPGWRTRPPAALPAHCPLGPQHSRRRGRPRGTLQGAPAETRQPLSQPASTSASLILLLKRPCFTIKQENPARDLRDNILGPAHLPEIKSRLVGQGALTHAPKQTGGRTRGPVWHLPSTPHLSNA